MGTTIKNTNKIQIKDIILGGIVSAMSIILYLIPLIKYPQGGGITLLSMLPIMLLSLIRGVKIGLMSGLIFGFLKIFTGFYMVHIFQFLLDYLLSTMALGLSGIFGYKNKINIIIGCAFSLLISVMLNVISGYVFFSQFAPQGSHPFIYSLVYNFSSAGVEGLLTIIVLSIIPITKIAKITNK